MRLDLIGVTGKAGVGKDTVADYLVSAYGYTKISFAAILKNMLRVAGLPEPEDRADKERIIEGFNFSWREAAQCLGTEWGRTLDNEIWVKLTMAALAPDTKYVFSDVRFDNEAAIIRERGGHILHLTGRGVDMGELNNHPSEAGVYQAAGDSCIPNKSNKETLYKEVDKMMTHGTIV